MATVLKLLYGDKRSPSRTLDLNPSSKKIYIRDGGFGPVPGQLNTQWASGSIRQAGARRAASNRDNAVVELAYDLRGDQSRAEVAYWQHEVNRFALECGLYEEDRQGEPVWIEYRFDDGLEGLPAPVFGQFSHYLRVYQVDPSWPRGGPHTELFQSSYAVQDVVSRLVVAPHSEGLRQRTATAKGQTQLMDDGVLAVGSVTNAFTNPSFGHSTWNNGWSVSNANLKAEQETRKGLTRSMKSAARLFNTDAAAARQFTQTLTLTAVDYVISCYARRPDAAAVTSSDIQLWGQGGVLTTSFQSVGDGWYLCYATYTAAAVGSTHGVQVKIGREVIVDDFQVELSSGNVFNSNNKPSPFCAGHLIGCSWSGTAHASTSSRPTPFFKWTLENEMAGMFSASLWATPYWDDDWPDTNLTMLTYSVDANNYITVAYNAANSYFTLDKTVGGSSTTDNGAVQTIAYGTAFHLLVVQDTTTCKLYVNGSEDISITVNAPIPPDGVLALGMPTDGASGSAVALDGFRIWTDALSATEALALYNAEEPVKTDGGLIGPPPFLWIVDGDDVFDNVDDTNRNNWGVIGGVSGDVEAEAEWEITPPTASPSDVYWLGRKATDDAFIPALLWMELQGTVDAGSSDGEYQEQTSAAQVFYTNTFSSAYRYDIAKLRGRYQFLARFYVATNNVDVVPRVDWRSVAGDSLSGDTVTVATGASVVLRDLGDLTMDWLGGEDYKPSTYRPNIAVTPVTGSSTTRCDFVMLLPYPFYRIELGDSITVSAGDQIVVTGGQAFLKSSADMHRYFAELRGDEVGLVPGKYNYVWFLQGEEGQTYNVAQTATFAVYVTPRFLTAGGLVS